MSYSPIGDPRAKKAVGSNSKVGYLINGCPVPEPIVYETSLDEESVVVFAPAGSFFCMKNV